MDSKLDMLNGLIEEGNKFTFENFCFPDSDGQNQFAGGDTPEWLTWKTRTLNIVTKLATKDSSAFALAKQASIIETWASSSPAFEQVKSNFLKSLEIVRTALESDVYGELRTGKSEQSSPVLSNRIFVVHGHDSGLKTDVEQFLRDIGLDPVVLHREADEGATLIEKFEKHSDVGYAFILLTPDEIAYTVDQKDKEDKEREKEIRARPNVIFEFGYFVGKLGRDRVCCLYKGDVTLPSDLAGLVYKKVDDSVDTQGMAIIRELKAAGYEVRV